MADSKITALTAITTVNPATYPLVIVDTSDTSMAITGTTKKVTTNQLLGSGGTATLASATITGDLAVRTNKLYVTATGVGCGMTPITPLSVSGAGGILLLRTTDPSAPVASPYLIAPVSTGFSSTSPVYAYWYQASGIGNPAVDTVSVITASSERYRIAADGIATWSNVGGVAGTAMTLNATGLGVGASPAERLTIGSSTAANYIKLTNTGATNGFLIGCYNTSVDIRNKEAGAMNFFTSDTQRMQIDSSGNLGIGVTPAGTGGCLQLKSGITFPATQVASSDANTLDDYEEGTWTPNVGGTATYTTQTGRYVKIGNRVFITLRMTINTIGTGDDYRILGLPFQPAATLGAASVGYFANLKISANFISGYASTGGTVITMTGTTAASANITNGIGVFGNGSDIVMSCFYEV